MFLIKSRSQRKSPKHAVNTKASCAVIPGPGCDLLEDRAVTGAALTGWVSLSDGSPGCCPVQLSVSTLLAKPEFI